MSTSARTWRQLFFYTALSTALLATGCSDDDDDGPDPDPTPMMTPDMTPDATPDPTPTPDMTPDATPDPTQVIDPGVTVSDMTLELTTWIIVDEVTSDGPGWVVIHEDDGNDAPGAVLGWGEVEDGTFEDVEVWLERPAEDGETLYAMLHTDAGTVGEYEFPGPDGPVLDDDGNVIAPPFVVTVPDGTPDAEFVIGSMGATGYTWDEVWPPFLDLVGDGDEDNDISLELGWRYRITNTVVGPHPFELLTIGAGPDDDVVLLSQNTGTDGSLEADADINWVEGDEGKIDFTVSASLAAELTGYRCAIHRANMRGNMTVLGEEEVVPSVTVADQTLEDLSTKVVVAGAVSDGPGWIVIHADNNGAPGDVIGNAALTDGENSDITVWLSRPAATGETLYAMLHTDAGTVGTYEFPGDDGPVMDGDGNVITPPFVVTVAATVPAVRFQLSSQGATGYLVDQQWPAAEVIGDLVGDEADDPTITLQQGWRYEINNTVTGPHPFELLTIGADAGSDVILASQAGGVDGSLEADADVAWNHDGDTIQFTLSASLAAELTGYRCGIHVGSMRGQFTLTGTGN